MRLLAILCDKVFWHINSEQICRRVNQNLIPGCFSLTGLFDRPQFCYITSAQDLFAIFIISCFVAHLSCCSMYLGAPRVWILPSSADELPAYILVMLDNKRQWNDISQELEVFLVESTEPFVEWLKKEIDREFTCGHFTTLGPASGTSINTVIVICMPMYVLMAGMYVHVLMSGMYVHVLMAGMYVHVLMSGMYVHIFCSCFVTVWSLYVRMYNSMYACGSAIVCLYVSCVYFICLDSASEWRECCHEDKS